ncbi:MAG TPA: DeoR/GlpR family DNA-binding transcription regulator [Trebonia sp.]|nr:DeoR/GlpR family DNA-binding transcription regulator [Trebonia sp.]
MYAEERQVFILGVARREGRVDAGMLAEQLNVSAETIRRDLTALERQGVLRRTHGGAIPIQRLGFDPMLMTRASTMVEEKARIGKAAAEYLPAEGSILIDGGSTTAALAEVIPGDRLLTVLTGALPTALSLATRDNLTVLMPGGTIRPRSMCLVGPWAQRELGDVCVDTAFIGTNGLSVERGLTTSDQSEAVTKQAMIKAARRVVLLCDHSKIGADDFYRFAGLSEVDVLITDSGLDPDLAEDLRAAVPTVILT